MPRSTRFLCRCTTTSCRSRHTLKRHPDNYIRPRKCHCGGKIKVDKAAMKRRETKKVCHCDGYWFMHEKGYGACIHAEEMKIERAMTGKKRPDSECPF